MGLMGVAALELAPALARSQQPDPAAPASSELLPQPPAPADSSAPSSSLSAPVASQPAPLPSASAPQPSSSSPAAQPSAASPVVSGPEPTKPQHRFPAPAPLWDLGLAVGPTKRYLGSRETGGGDAGMGAGAELRGHVRVMSGLSAGAYAGWEYSPVSPTTRHIFGLGARLRWVPVPSSGSTQWWVFGGLGYALAWSPSFDTTLPVIVNGAPKLSDATVESASGTFFEVPLGVGLGSAPKRHRLQFHAELAVKIGFGHRGALYDLESGRNATAVLSKMPIGISNPGADAVGLGLLVGARWSD